MSISAIYAKKLKGVSDTEYIETIWGIGYRICQ